MKNLISIFLFYFSSKSIISQNIFSLRNSQVYNDIGLFSNSLVKSKILCISLCKKSSTCELIIFNRNTCFMYTSLASYNLVDSSSGQMYIKKE